MDISDLHPLFIEREGKKEYAVLPIDKFERLTTFIEDARDLFLLKQAKAEDDGTRISLEMIEEELGIVH